jgi:hypothetical protein
MPAAPAAIASSTITQKASRRLMIGSKACGRLDVYNASIPFPVIARLDRATQ